MSYNENEAKPKFAAKPVTYCVSVDGCKYYYALHSTKRYKIIYPSQALNILEYCLFKDLKSGKFKATEINDETFPFEIERLEHGQPTEEPWAEYEEVKAGMKSLLKTYFNNIKDSFSLNNAE